ncbi:PAP2 superfamily protein [uncultured archaeon]|nr:PAP2 superfamily protein [uncultured archaeon]
MDPISTFAFTLNNPAITAVSNLLDNDALFAVVLLAALLLGERRPNKIAKIIVAVSLALLVGFGIKAALAIERPCAQLGLAYCPEGYSFPSLHAVAAFTLAIAFLNKRSFPLYLLFALFVAFTRLIIAAHSFRDIAGALPLALIAYYLVDLAWNWKNGGSKNGRD